MTVKNIYYEPAYKAISSLTPTLLRDFSEIQRQVNLTSRMKTMDSLKKVCLESLKKQLQRSTGYPVSETLHTGFYWFINPLDGYDNFIRGSPLFAASVSLMKEDDPVISLINMPFFKNIFSVERGEGVHSNFGQHSVNRNLDINKSYIADNNFGCDSIAYIYTACGNFDGFDLRISEAEVNIAQLFIKEAGGEVSRIGPRIIGSNQLIHGELRQKVMSHTLTTVKQGISFCCGPTQKIPGWSGSIYEKGLISRSHRSKEGINRIKEVQELIREVLQVPKDHKVLLINGSATGAVECAFFNFLGHRPINNVAYDVFGRRWASEIKKMLQNEKKVDKNKVFFNNLEYKQYIEGDKTYYEIENNVWGDLVFVYNGTSTGRRWQAFNFLKRQAESDGLCICDATSALFAESMPWQYLDVTCGSFQKALGAEAGLAVVILSPKAQDHLRKMGRIFTPPRIIRLDPEVIDEISSGKLINTISMLNLQEISHNLRWAAQNGGLNFLQRRCIQNQKEIIDQIPVELELTIKDLGARCLTVLCLKPTDPKLQNWEYIHKISAKAAEIGIYETAGHPEEVPCWRFWTGPTVDQASKGFANFLKVYHSLKKDFI